MINFNSVYGDSTCYSAQSEEVIRQDVANDRRCEKDTFIEDSIFRKDLWVGGTLQAVNTKVFGKTTVMEMIKLVGGFFETLISRRQGLIAEDATFDLIQVNKKGELTNCSATNLDVIDDGCELRGGSYNCVEVLKKASILETSIQQSISSTVDSLEWSNTKLNEARPVISAHLDVALTNVKGSNTISKAGKVDALNCDLENVVAFLNAQLTNSKVNDVKAGSAVLRDTEATSVNVVNDSLTVIGDKKELYYNSLHAKNNIDLMGLTAKSVKSFEGTLKAENCTLFDMECNQSIQLINCTGNNTIRLKIDPTKPCKLDFKGTKIFGNIIIDCGQSLVDLPPKPSAAAIAAKQVTTTNIGVSLNVGMMIGYDTKLDASYSAVREVERSLRDEFWRGRLLDANNSMEINKKVYKYVDGKLIPTDDLPKATVRTLESVKAEILKNSAEEGVSDVNLNGGRYKVIDGRYIVVLKSEPGLNLTTENMNPEQANVLPIEISGGILYGKIIFENFHGYEGELNLINGAEIKA